MFIPTPPESDSERAQKQIEDVAGGQDVPDVSVPHPDFKFLYCGIALQGLSAVCTFLPWTKFMWQTFAGFEPHDLAFLYDGLAGKLNLLFSLVLVVAATAAVMRGSVPVLALMAVVMMIWNLALSVWLIVLHVRLGEMRDIGLSLTLAAAIGVIACMARFWLTCRYQAARAESGADPEMANRLLDATLALDDPLWESYLGGRRVPYDAALVLRRLFTEEAREPLWDELWTELHHEDHVDQASYAAVPWLVEFVRLSPKIDWNALALIATIDLARDQNDNPQVAPELADGYFAAIESLPWVLGTHPDVEWSDSVVQSAAACMALARGQRWFARAYAELDRDTARRWFAEEAGQEFPD